MAAAADIAHHTVNMLPVKIALIGALGIGAQWLAWRLQRPAIVLMAIAGLIFGPLVGYLMNLSWMPAGGHDFLEIIRLNPISDFGDVYRPMIGLAVAIILFEGGLTLRFKDLGDASFCCDGPNGYYALIAASAPKVSACKCAEMGRHCKRSAWCSICCWRL